mgnify:FL=1
MKESRYNLILDGSSHRLAFNAMTCAFAEVDESFFEALEEVRKTGHITNNELGKQMRYGGFVVDDDSDELSLLRMRSWQAKFSEGSLGLTIAPTLACNFACPYCYEQARDGMMTKEVQDCIIHMVEGATRRRQSVHITWYGGEPLLALPIILEMSQSMIALCESQNVPYSAYMISNGFLLNEKKIQDLKAVRISGMQITVDGPRDIHDKRRILKHGPGGTFDRIIKNICCLLNSGLVPDIRINVDKTNGARLEELIVYFKEQGLEKCHISFGHVNAFTEACADIEGSCFSVEDYAAKSITYQRFLFENGFPASDYPLYPGIKRNYCCADSIGSYVVDPDGRMYKCWNDIGNASRSVGSVLDLGEASDAQQSLLSSYLLWSPFDHEKCLSCEILPICMGGCPYNGIRHSGEPECEKWKYNIGDALRFIYTNYERLGHGDESEP